MWPQIIGAGMMLAGDIMSGFGLNSRRKSTPQWKDMDMGVEADKAIATNIGNTPQLMNQAKQINAFNQAQIEKMLRDSVPQYDEMRNKTSANINSMLSGEIPKDVQDQIQRNGAAKALGGGYAGSGMNRNLVARDLGLTSLDLTQRGLNSAQSWISTMAKINQPAMWDFTSMFVTPGQQAEFDFQNQSMKMQGELLKWSLPNDMEYWGGKYQERGAMVMSMGMGSAGKGASGGGGFNMSQYEGMIGAGVNQGK
jgi:hypothetical protein